jgi:arginyl-tRNA synthetase
MTDPNSLLSDRLRPAFEAVVPGSEPVVRRSDRADFQADGALAAAKRAGRNPREVAVEVVAHAAIDDLATIEIAGPGFLNLTLHDDAIGSLIADMAGDGRLGITADPVLETVVVDYSAPNVAKELHIGHIRSTVIGDSIVRTLEFLGHDVIRQNHIGDWGTQFGMLIEHLIDVGGDRAIDELSIGDMNAFYQEARKSFDGDESFKERARQRVVLLQAGDPETQQLWRALVAESERHFQAVYERLGVRLQPDDNVGESFYNDRLNPVVDELVERGLAVESDGALVVFPPGFTARDGSPLPFIVRKSDGGFGYQATDLAAIRYRIRDLGATRLAYVVSNSQRDHLAMLFAVAEMAGWLVPPARAEHVLFGNILGEDRKMYRTRAGSTVKLVDVLDEAVDRAAVVVADKRPDFSPEKRAETAQLVGIGAIKYHDLANDRVKDYVFDWNRMLALNGNTAPYLQYAHARIRSIFRRGEIEPDRNPGAPKLVEPAERALAMELLGYEAAVRAAAEAGHPHRICTVLFDIASAFTAFYDACPVLTADDDESRRSRLVLCDLTARVLAHGLALLGIDAPEEM